MHDRELTVKRSGPWTTGWRLAAFAAMAAAAVTGPAVAGAPATAVAVEPAPGGGFVVLLQPSVAHSPPAAPILQRYLADGGLDTGFGVLGVAHLPLPPLNAEVHSLRLDGDGRISVPLEEPAHLGGRRCTFRFTADGRPDGGCAGSAPGTSASAPTATMQVLAVSSLPGSPGVIGFATPAPATLETAGVIVLLVSRTGGNAGTASVAWQTGAGSAVAGEDFIPGGGVLNWSVGDSAPRAITIGVLDDLAREGNEQFTVFLSGVSGAASGNTLAVVTIVDDDDPSAPPPPPPTTGGSGSLGTATLAGLLALVMLRRPMRFLG